MALTVITINILSDLSTWTKRRALLAKELADRSPDLIALQEVSLIENVSGWLAGELQYEHIFLSPKTGADSNEEGIAILSRLPFKAAETLPLPGQNRVAQVVQVQGENQVVTVANGHFYWQPGESTKRLQQIEHLLDRLAKEPPGRPIVVCGDFNSSPETDSIRRMKEIFRSTYEAIHRREPDYTTPTPLPVSKKHMLLTGVRYWSDLRLSGLLQGRRQTLDYIFVNPAVTVLNSQLVCDRPAPGRPNLYPSDHFGVLATLEV